MKCCICDKEISDYGNNPYPLCEKEDTQSRCCDECNSNYVIRARIMLQQAKNIELKNSEEPELVIIFYSSESDQPIKTLLSTGKFLAGYTDSDDGYEEAKKVYGTWGNFPINIETDSYMVVEK